jgi:glycosyltransferase involved in cell wall biosynthesis
MSSGCRLLVVTESLGIGGTESHLIRLSVPLAAQGFDTTIYCLSESGQRADQVEAAGIRVVSSPWPPKPRRTPANIAVAASRLFRLMRQWRPQIVHFYLPGPYLVGAPLAIAARVPIKVISRRSLSIYQRRRPLLGRLERALHRHMDAVIGNSRAVVAELNAEGIPSSKIRLIYNGIDTAAALPSRDQARGMLGVEPQTVVGIIVANLISYKGHKDLIEALARISPDLPSSWQLLCVGRDDGLKAKLETLAQTRNVKANIKFLGERLDTPTLLAAADFGVLSSWEEGFSNVILEAMSTGLPMIVTDVGGNAEAVVAERTGLVVPPRNPDTLGAAILRFAREPALRRKFSQAGQKRVREEFALERCVASHRALYEELLARSG